MDSGNDSPPHRTTILGSFLRGRPRNSVMISSADVRELSTSPPSPGGTTGGQRRSRGGTGAGAGVQASTSQPTTTNPTTTTLSSMLRRRRSAGTIAAPPPPPAPAPAPANPHRIRLVPHIDSRRTLRFDPITRDLTPGTPALRIGRFTDRSGLGLAAVNAIGSNRLAFKSKVVSRAHAEIWVEPGTSPTPRVFIKDTKSSSGTFLNHVRLSPANTESRPFQIKDGDILQLGVDYQGGTEDIYKSVKIRIELGREWQAGANAFNTNTLKILKTLAVPQTSTPTNTPKTQIPDCCICLFGVTIRQALFIAPCSHTFHYKCIRPLLETHHPVFSCPLCRTFADLDEDVEVDVDVEGECEGEGENERGESEGPNNAEGEGRTAEGGVEEARGAGAEDASANVETTPAHEEMHMHGVESEGSGEGVVLVGEFPVGGAGAGAPLVCDEMDVDHDHDHEVLLAVLLEEEDRDGEHKPKEKVGV